MNYCRIGFFIFPIVDYVVHYILLSNFFSLCNIFRAPILLSIKVQKRFALQIGLGLNPIEGRNNRIYFIYSK